jgi:rhomboid protease GluP
MNTTPEPAPRPVYLSVPMHRPVVTYILLGLIVVVFGAETLAGGSTQTDVLIKLGAKYSPLIASGQYWRLFTAMFLHIGWLHLLFNAYALVVIGTDFERIVGWQRFLAVYLLSGLFGDLASYAFSPHLAAGASGAIFGVIGALGAFFALYRERLGRWGRARLGNILFLIAINLFYGFTSSGIDNYGHLGGLLSGALLGLALAPRYQPDPASGRLVDRTSLERSLPVLVLAVLLLVGGTIFVTRAQADSAVMHLVRGEAAIDREAWDEAVTELELAVAKDPASANAYFDLGLAHNKLNQPELAAPAYESAIELEPEFSEAHWNLAFTYWELGRTADARSELEIYLKLNPDEADSVQYYLDQLQP